MGIQEVLVVCLFIAAVVYIGKMLYKNAKPNDSCGTNCKCGVDFSKINLPDNKTESNH